MDASIWCRWKALKGKSPDANEALNLMMQITEELASEPNPPHSLLSVTESHFASREGQTIQADDEIFPARFEPSKITDCTLDHHLDNQMARIILEQKDACGWVHGDRTTFLSRYQVSYRPDGLIALPSGTVIAIKTDRHLKTKVRYQSIIASHLLARTRKDWIYVFYIVPDPQKKRGLERLFDSIQYVIVNHQHIPLETRHRNVFRIYTIDELQRLDIATSTQI